MKKQMKPGRNYFVINIDEPYAKAIYEVLKAGQIAKDEWPEGDITFEEWVKETWGESETAPGFKNRRCRHCGMVSQFDIKEDLTQPNNISSTCVFCGFPLAFVKDPPESFGGGVKKPSKAGTRHFKVGDYVQCRTSRVRGVVIRFYTPTASEEQTMVETDDGRRYHAPTRDWEIYR